VKDAEVEGKKRSERRKKEVIFRDTTLSFEIFSLVYGKDDKKKVSF